MAQQKESIFKEQVLKDLKNLRHAWFFKTQEVSVRGIPDIILCMGGLFIALELKASVFERANELQSYNLKRITASGGKSYLCNPANWPMIFAQLTTYDKENLRLYFGPNAPKSNID